MCTPVVHTLQNPYWQLSVVSRSLHIARTLPPFHGSPAALLCYPLTTSAVWSLGSHRGPRKNLLWAAGLPAEQNRQTQGEWYACG
jgi:hypothetical protein